MKKLKRQTDRLWENTHLLSDKEFIQLDAFSLATGLKQGSNSVSFKTSTSVGVFLYLPPRQPKKLISG